MHILTLNDRAAGRERTNAFLLCNLLSTVKI